MLKRWLESALWWLLLRIPMHQPHQDDYLLLNLLQNNQSLTDTQ